MSAKLSRGTSPDSPAYQTLIEHQILEHVTSALRLCIQWEVTAVGMAKKLSSVRFTAQSFQRHLERILDLEEKGGYLGFVRETRPTLHERRMALRTEHDRFRATLAEIMDALNGLGEDDAEEFRETCYRLELLLAELDLHHTNEIDLIQEAMADVGGEG